MGPLAPLNVSLLIYNFVVKFGDKVFQNEYTMKIENKSELHGFYITLTILLFIGIISKIYLAVNKNGSGDPVVSNQSQNQSSIGQDVWGPVILARLTDFLSLTFLHSKSLLFHFKLNECGQLYVVDKWSIILDWYRAETEKNRGVQRFSAKSQRGVRTIMFDDHFWRHWPV